MIEPARRDGCQFSYRDITLAPVCALGRWGILLARRVVVGVNGAPNVLLLAWSKFPRKRLRFFLILVVPVVENHVMYYYPVLVTLLEHTQLAAIASCIARVAGVPKADWGCGQLIGRSPLRYLALGLWYPFPSPGPTLVGKLFLFFERVLVVLCI